MNVLVACEYSGRVRDAFAKRGHHAVSADLLPSDTNGWHYKGNVFDILREREWDLLIAFPPCTYISKVGAAYYPKWIQNGQQDEAINFFLDLWEAPITKIAIENPVGRMSTVWRKPDQYIEPYQFGDPWQKKTCLWLKNLPQLRSSKPVVPKGHWVDGGTYNRPGQSGRMEGAYKVGTNNQIRAHERAKTFIGIAQAMAKQWG